MKNNALSRRALLGGALTTAAAAAYAPSAFAGVDPIKAGVNIAGLEFSSSKLPGRVNIDYPAPKAAEIAYYRSRGARTLRLPFLWERLQPTLMGPFNQQYLALIDGVVTQAHSLGMSVVIDAHQYGRRRQNGVVHIIGQSSAVTAQHFAHMWRWLAYRYKRRPVIYGLCNEPHDQDKTVLVNVQNAAIAAIRATGSRQLVLASGSAWSGANSWVSSGNAQAMLGIRDPANNFAFDVHQYLDSTNSGTSATCVAKPGCRLDAFTPWARQNRRRGFLGEFGGGPNSGCNVEITELLDHIRANRDVWVGWTAWAGGDWWGDDYPFNLRPSSLTNPVDKPQMAVLRRYWA